MNREQTLELWSKGEEAWNAWALAALQQKQQLEEKGLWSVDWFGEGQNGETKGWLAETRADFAGAEFAADAEFQNYVFPGPAVFDGAHFLGKAQFTAAQFAHIAGYQGARFDGEALFKQAKFRTLAVFDEAAFASAADFERAEFQRESTGPLAPAVRFQKTQFASRAEFRGVKFTGHAEFVRARFGSHARFDEAEFLAEANFSEAAFEGTAGLLKARFQGAAKFDQARFAGDARFGEAAFGGAASFEGGAFEAKSSFRGVKFGGETSFDRARFVQDARFGEASFAQPAHFRQSAFTMAADFQKASFAASADFTGARFGGDSDFTGAIFAQAVDFTEARFKGPAGFTEAAFRGSANFAQAVFRSRASFRRADFAGMANFAALQSRGAFVLAGSRFAEVPSFQEASFQEPAGLDDIVIADPMRLFPPAKEGRTDPRPFFLRAMKACADADTAPRYRRLRQFAADNQDYEREREFFAQELRCRRFWLDRPFGRGMGRFWLGWAYGGLSDFGRSLGRPLAAWALSIPLFALVYLAERRSFHFASAPGPVASGAPMFPDWPPQPSVMSVLDWFAGVLWWLVMSVVNLFSGGGCIFGESGATGEALFLSLKNAFFFLGWESADAARRVYSCLYGMESTAGAQLLRVPLIVSTTAIAQNMFSAFVLFLAFLALRNILRAR